MHRVWSTTEEKCFISNSDGAMSEERRMFFNLFKSSRNVYIEINDNSESRGSGMTPATLG